MGGLSLCPSSHCGFLIEQLWLSILTGWVGGTPHDRQGHCQTSTHARSIPRNGSTSLPFVLFFPCFEAFHLSFLHSNVDELQGR
ncbi:hypothetical protein QR685DRAFT_520337 [Neurospora intermedia]|uniref:Secreted protein n=1 Tax=Neurospora intermedia TaxID=5142 RepID=A0ABR3DJ25_NEUIN